MDNQKVKGYLITKSLNRTKRALAEGFYLEAIVLVDSLITDRLNVIAHYATDVAIEVKGVNNGVRNLTKAQVKIYDSELVAETLVWGKERNAAVHGFSKLGEFEDLGWNQRIKMAKGSAETGLKLAKRWLAEAKKHRI
jgi:hypothetical protein